MEFLPVLEKRGDTLAVTGCIERAAAHGKDPVFHGTAIVVPVLPDGRLLLTDKTEKQRKKGRDIPENTRIFDVIGGHLAYDDVPGEETQKGVSMHTFLRCAARELSEELFYADGSPIGVAQERLLPVGMYTVENDHNKEYSWVFVYPVQAGEFHSADTLETQAGIETVPQPVCPMTWAQVTALYEGQTPHRLSDALGRVLAAGDGEHLLACIKAQTNSINTQRG